LVVWLGVTVTTTVVTRVVALLFAVCANTVSDVWFCIPRIIAADIITTTVVAAAITTEDFIIALIMSNSI